MSQSANMPPETAEALELLAEILVSIRGIASDANFGRHSLPGRPYLGDSGRACAAIQDLADMAHNLPLALAPDGPRFLLQDALAQARDALLRVRG